jgi:hypothetical protein
MTKQWEKVESCPAFFEPSELELEKNGWLLKAFDMEPDLSGALCEVSDKGEFGMVTEIGSVAAYTVLLATGPDAAGNQRKLITAFDRFGSKAKQSRGLALRLLKERARGLATGE